MHADHNDDEMDRLLRETLSADPPELSPAFDVRVLRAVQPRRLSTIGRAVIALYAVAAAVVVVWAMRDLDIRLVGAAVTATVPIAAGVSAYGRYLVRGV